MCFVERQLLCENVDHLYNFNGFPNLSIAVVSSRAKFDLTETLLQSLFEVKLK
jgi:hypothetical protein